MPNVLASFARRAMLVLLVASPSVAGASSLSGAYLAAMQADYRDDYAEASAYFDETLKLDPGNPGLLTNAVVSLVAMGEVDKARVLADRLETIDAGNQIAMLVRLADEIADGNFAEADTILSAADDGAMNPLLGGLLGGWIEVGKEDFPSASARFDGMKGNDALAAYGQYHKALALGYAGDFVSAAEILAGDADGPLHLNRAAIVAHAEILAQIGREKDAVAVLDEALSGGVPDAPIIALRDRLSAGEEVPFDLIGSPGDGAAQAFLTLADALNGEDSERVALVHARLAAHIEPELAEADLLAADILESQEQYTLASAALSAIPDGSPWYVSSQVRLADTQRASGDADAGIATLTALAEGNQDRIEVDSALGDALRMAERFPESVSAYSKAIDKIETPRAAHWVLYYTRGIATERAGNWPAAESDFREALKLEPGQPLVLNYLGYSMVEQQENLDEALGMIEQAVRAQPDDGYITDSLGWVYFRLGRYQDAVSPMLRAVELTPDDPVINDHLGDVLWMVGRQREAEFQWRRALSFGPADDLDMDRVRKKLDIGLDAVLSGEKDSQEG